MTVLRRRSQPAPEPPRRRGTGRRAPLEERFPRGQRVQVYADYHDMRYAEKLGVVVKTISEPDDHYPHGRVAVLLEYNRLVQKLFGGKPPNPVWFKPADLERL